MSATDAPVCPIGRGRPNASKLAMHRQRATEMAEVMNTGGVLTAGSSAVALILELSDGLQALVAEVAGLHLEAAMISDRGTPGG